MVLLRPEGTEYRVGVAFLSLLLAASAQNRCTALVCSCYAPTNSFIDKGKDPNRNNNSQTKNSSPSESKNGVVIEELGKRNGSRYCKGSETNGHHREHPILKSSLRKTSARENRPRSESKKVNWLDSHGKDVAQVHEFDPSSSVSDTGELEGVRNPCVCAIQ